MKVGLILYPNTNLTKLKTQGLSKPKPIQVTNLKTLNNNIMIPKNSRKCKIETKAEL